MLCLNYDSYFCAKIGFDQSVCHILILEQIPGVYWMYKTESHAAELTAGFYNPHNRDGYYAITEMLKKQGAALNFTCSELGNVEPGVDLPLALGNPDGLSWQVSTYFLNLSEMKSRDI